MNRDNNMMINGGSGKRLKNLKTVKQTARRIMWTKLMYTYIYIYYI